MCGKPSEDFLCLEDPQKCLYVYMTCRGNVMWERTFLFIFRKSLLCLEDLEGFFFYGKKYPRGLSMFRKSPKSLVFLEDMKILSCLEDLRKNYL